MHEINRNSGKNSTMARSPQSIKVQIHPERNKIFNKII